ncbi:cytochrome P450 [Micromonospora sp. NPDC049559]|uniref:cytochrome P450 n=1 Tax=Micromonospora sp. NPDC049559 TaxID=3155923 RepID=UPI0034417C14
MSVDTIPDAAGLPLIGALLDFRRDPLETYLRAQRDHGDVVRFTVGPPGLRQEFYAVFSAEGAQQVLARSVGFRKDDAFYDEIRQTFGNGLLTSQDADYVRQRRLIQPLFTRRRVDRYARAMCEETSATLAEWRDRDGEVIDVLAEVTRLTQRVVTRVLFGAASEEAADVVGRNFPLLGEWMLRRGFSPLPLPRWVPTPANRRAAAARRELYEVCDRIIAERSSGGAEHGDLLNLLLQAGDDEDDRLAPAEIRDQVLVFFLAGHETTATSMMFALYLLAGNPEVQRRAREEAERVLGDRMPEAADFDRLAYVHMAMKEAMRLYPPSPGISRRATADTEINGQVIPAGKIVLLSPWVTQRHPAYWPDPERFDPERFTPEREAARPRYAWFPFGGGPRACIGQHFSMLEAVLAIALMLREYEFHPVDTEIKLTQKLALRSVGPIRCRISAR